MIWRKLIDQNAPAPTQPNVSDPSVAPDAQPELVGPELDKFLRFRAVVDGYRLLAELEAQKAAMAQAMPGMPGPLPGPTRAKPPQLVVTSE
jgi:hypothetical protein